MTRAVQQIYLDHNATAPVRPEVKEALVGGIVDVFGNPSAPYRLGLDARRALKQAREQVGALIGADPGNLIFTSGGTEADNLALKGVFAPYLHAHEPCKVIISAVEHPAVLETARELERRGVSLVAIPVSRSGAVDVAAVFDAVDENTRIVSIMHANNETGSLQPVAEIGEGLRERGILFHVDGVQAVGKMTVSVNELGCDFYSISGHKFGALKGCGALYVREPGRLQWIQQGGHQEHGLRAGTENVPGIVSMGIAAEVTLASLEEETARASEVRKVFDGLTERMPMCRLNGHPQERLPNTSNLCILYADAMSLCMALSVKGIYVGTGSACASHTKEPSRVLRAMGLSDMAAYCSIRISSGPETTVEMAEHAASEIVDAVEMLRLVSAPESIGECDDNCPCFIDP